MKIHFIAIGGSAMHNLALALHDKGYQVTGSDDQIFEPSRSRLQKAGILPEQEGWFPEKINTDLDAIILGMHARIDNPELLKAQELGLHVYSYPEFLYEQTKDKKRVVIGGSHGKTSITSMILHVLRYHKIECDFMVGAQLEGFDRMVNLEQDTEIAIFEGDEYLSSPLDRRPKFFHYKPHVAMISGIAWDHINVFPTFEGYVDQFRQFTHTVDDNGTMYWYQNDPELNRIMSEDGIPCKTQSYEAHPHIVENGVTSLITESGNVPLRIFGKHNMENLQAAMHLCSEIGVSPQMFYSAMESFGGAARRLELLEEKDNTSIFRDFAHSPSKLKATTSALKEQYDNRQLIACMELHTFSSLSAEFLDQYKGTMSAADRAIVFFSPKAIEHKKLVMITPEQVAEGFGGGVEIFTDTEHLANALKETALQDSNLLLMSSGNYGGIDVFELAETLISAV